MLLQTSEIKSLVGHTYNRPHPCFTEKTHSVILGDKEHLMVGKVARSLGEHQGLGLNVHQNFVVLPRVKSRSSTLVLNQRGAYTSSPSVGLRLPLPEVGWRLVTSLLTNL